MQRDRPKHRTPDSPFGDIAYLWRSEHRILALVAMAERPRTRAELGEVTGVSSSTIRRTLNEFEDRVWITRDGSQFAATRLGEAIAVGAQELIDRVETERTLREVWHWLPEEVSEFPIETWSDLTVTVADRDVPYRPVKRFESLLSEASTVRYLRADIALMDPCLDVLARRADAGIDVTLIDRPTSHAYFLSTYPERSRELMGRENVTILEHDDCPRCGIGLLDDRVVISCREQDCGTVQTVIDTDAPAIREWAESTYTAYESDAPPLEPHRLVE